VRKSRECPIVINVITKRQSEGPESGKNSAANTAIRRTSPMMYIGHEDVSRYLPKWKP
jgi:hypothetical protein